MPSRIQTLAGLLLAALAALPAAAESRVSLRLGVLAYQDEERAVARYQPLVDYLNAKLVEERVELRVLSEAGLDRAIAADQIDLVTSNPSHFVATRARESLSGALVTLVEDAAGQPVRHLAGAIVARADRAGIDRLADLRDKSIAVPGATSVAGYQAQALELLDAGIRLPGQVRSLLMLESDPAVARAVLEGRADAGFLRAGELERLLAAGLLEPGALKVVAARDAPDFPYQVSTRLYPQWPVYALPHVGERAARHVVAALLDLEADHEAARAAGIHGYTLPADYIAIDEMARALRLPPYDRLPDFTLADAWQRWRLEILLAALAFTVIALLASQLAVVWRRELRERNRVQLLLSALGEGVYGTDRAGHCVFVNQAALDMLGAREEEVLGHDQHALFHHHHPDGRIYPAADCPIQRTAIDGEKRRVEEWFFRKDGRGFPVELVVTPLIEDGRSLGAVAVFQDISTRKAMEARLTELANTDALTGLANRRHFLTELDHELERVQRSGKPGSLLMLDIDHFKRVNDSHGHAAGDRVLQALAGALASHLRRVDRVGRLGGEEFAILMPETPLDSALAYAERLRARIGALVVEAEGASIRFTISIGVAGMDVDDLRADPLLARADAALYRAKQAGRDRVEVAT